MKISYLACLFAIFLASSVALAEGQNINQGVNTVEMLSGQDGATLFQANCQSCHMAGGEGTSGAGMYPSLVKNPNMENPDYPAFIIMNGLRGMPAFSSDLSDEQIVELTNFITNNFGNNSKTLINIEDVRAMRPTNKVNYE